MGRKKLQRYYDQKLVGSYGGVVPDQAFERWLSEQDTYTLHKLVRRRFKRRCVVVKNRRRASRKVQQNFEDPNVALFHKETIASVRRRATGLCTIVQQHISPHYWYGTVRGECNKPGRGLATPLRFRKCGNTEVHRW